MSELKSVNVTKYDAGGSGDNYIEDGYIKSVEKVWIDSYTTTTTPVVSADSILIGYVPKNKKITEVIVRMPAMYASGVSNGTICLGTGSDMVVTASSVFFGEMFADGYRVAGGVYNMSTAATLRLAPGKFATVTPKRLALYIKIIPAQGDVTSTSGTIRSIIKYT